MGRLKNAVKSYWLLHTEKYFTQFPTSPNEFLATAYTVKKWGKGGLILKPALTIEVNVTEIGSLTAMGMMGP